MKNWVQKALDFLQHSLDPIPQELNELDWKEDLSPDNRKFARHLSAFANLPGGGFLVFGIENTAAKPFGINQQQVEAILKRLSNLCRDAVTPAVAIDHAIEHFRGMPLLFIHIKENAVKPVFLKPGSFEDAYIRCGGETRRASRREIGGLMLNSKTPQYEELHASPLMAGSEVLDRLDFRTLFKLLEKPVPQTSSEILDWMKDERMIEQADGAGYYITNFGALAAAHAMKDFELLERKAIRLIKYAGINKLETEKEYLIAKGYAICFDDLIAILKALLPASEIIKSALRRETSVYPELALRELIANALIHQDFGIRGMGPMIEIFSDRIEISNPGKLLPSKKIDRLIRTTPESRNEILAAAFRRYNICEERGSGLEKAVTSIELYGLPPLKFEELENAFRITMYSPKPFASLTPAERVEACYQHSIIKYYSSGGLTNISLRERFKLSEKKRSQVSIVIKDALAKGKIKPRNPENIAPKFAEYIPAWG